MPRPLAPLLLVAACVIAAAAALAAQRPFSRYARVDLGDLPDERSGFTFCRLVYDRAYRESGGSGWNTDYPEADQNLMIRLSDFTTAEITRFGNGDPWHAVVRASDSALFQCPFLYAVDVGTAGLNDFEAERLREYLLKGGFLWVDDFWGSYAWSRWLMQMARVFPEFEVEELPIDHEIFSTFYSVDRVPQIPSIQFWRRNGGQTSERGTDSSVAHLSGIFDDNGRLIVLMSHNTDIADAWEREGEDWEFFHLFSPRGYAVGINVAIWSMTH